MIEPKRILLLGAVEAEIDLLRDRMSGALIDLNDQQYRMDIDICSVGNIDAALSLQSVLSQNQLDVKSSIAEVIFIGSAGSYHSDRYPIGSTVYSNSFAHLDTGSMRKMAKIPPLMIHRIESVFGDIATFIRKQLSMTCAVTNSIDSISLVDMEAEAKDNGIDVENMETFGLARAAQMYSVPFSAFFCITNRVGPDGSVEWQQNYRTLSEDLQQRIVSALKLLI